MVEGDTVPKNSHTKHLNTSLVKIADDAAILRHNEAIFR